MKYNSNSKAIIDKAIEVVQERNKRTSKHSSHVTKTSFNLYRYGNKNGKQCSGSERLPQVSYDNIRWVSSNIKELKTSGNFEKPEEYECLVLFYDRIANYADITPHYNSEEHDGITVSNSVQMFTGIQLLGYWYDSAKKNGKGGYFCAYRPDDRGEKILRPGQIQFFFTHTLEKKKQDSTTKEVKHYFAFVRWFKFPNYNQILSSFTHDHGSCWKNEFEDISEDCILPVHKLHSGISIKLESFKSINVVAFLPRRFN